MFQRWLQSWRQTTIANKFIVGASCVVAVATVVYAIVAYFQWQALLYSNKTNREALESVQRAFVVFRTIDAAQTNFMDKGELHPYFIFSIPLENTGTTPANGIADFFTAETLQSEPTEEQFIRGIPERASLVVGPKDQVHIGRLVKPISFIFYIPLGKFTHTETVSDKGIYFWGWLSYRDIFPQSKVHITEFCQQISAVGMNKDKFGRPDPAGGYKIAFTNCKYHNCADNDCQDYEQIAAIPTPK